MNELKSKFISKLAIKVIIFVFIMTVVLFIAQSVSPIMTNYLALGQMQNSDEAFVVMNTYNRFQPVIRIIFVGICILFTTSLVKDTYKFVKNINELKNEKEN